MNVDKPAFPRPSGPFGDQGSEGMTLRQYAAIKAMEAYVCASHAVLLNASIISGEVNSPEKNDELRKAIAEGSIAMADALLEELSK